MKALQWFLFACCLMTTFAFCDGSSIDMSNTPSPPPLSQASENYKKILTETALMVLGLIGFILLTIFILKKFVSQKTFQLNRERHIKVIERRPLSAKTSLYLVQVGSQKILLTESQLEVRSHVQIGEDSKNAANFFEESETS